ncbi:NAD(P)-dependent oxidoreductase [Brevirhabdus pacifica]|uniref:NAD(P)-dependent oxidoreductase n=1 Tax=Brevirhabdus pacifica TaxID=1267768 RepID=A0A1U7DG02_9RHOB|nr:SDR family oxidoreductase [Brevirhabdus pacifica]APX88829.1 NAD(P)-dependent oxidoreductase [Brevirhabdus pacifica]OWU80071.1 short-chain dehydrogenase [Loktanella sp. 22II-4b]PJJ86636.1 NAD(P)-dependent dehydrogenase (short-subunit alcohol dehydrogenase family) [Brevirhabdus pacifica]
MTQHSDDRVQDRQPGIESRMDPAPDYSPRYPGSGRLKGKVALITGGDSGIGRATAVLFAREGAKVAVVYLDEDTDAETTAAAIRDEGSEAFLLRGDVGDKAFCEDAVAQTVEKFGGLDVLVNNAAEQHAQDDFTDVSEEQITRTFRTNIFGHMFMVQAALPHLKKGASIIGVTSVTAYRGQDLLIDYASTKGAILSFVRALSSRLAGKGIRVNGVAPGPIWTPLIPASFPPEKVKDFGKSSPLGRPGQPNEVAPSLLFLACEDASFMTGQVLHPNGGDLIGG